MTNVPNAIGTMLVLAAMGSLGAHAVAATEQVVIGKHGMTHAGQTLQRDVLNMAHNVVPILTERLTKNPQSIACGRMERTDTVVTKMGLAGQWSETWTWTVCETILSVPIEFMPDGQGGTTFTFNGHGATVRPATKNGNEN